MLGMGGGGGTTRAWARRLALGFSMVTGAAHAAPPSTESCPPSGPWSVDVVRAKGAAEFSVDPRGEVTRSEGPRQRGTIGFFEGPSTGGATPDDLIFVRIFAVSSRHPQSMEARLFRQGYLHVRDRVQLVRLPTDGDVWRDTDAWKPLNTPKNCPTSSPTWGLNKAGGAESFAKGLRRGRDLNPPKTLDSRRFATIRVWKTIRQQA